jgi:hypothetical protein
MPPEESPEARFDRLKKQLQDSILRDYPNPDRKGCPDGAVLRELAERPLDESVERDPYWHHLTHCSECYREFLNLNNAYRGRVKARRVRVQGVVGATAAIVVVAVLFGWTRGSFGPIRPQNAEVAFVKKTVDIPSFTRSANAGDPKPIMLERQPLELTVQLPVGSKAGRYELQLKKAEATVVSTSSEAQLVNGTTSFTVKVNLSGFSAGDYSINVRQVPFDWNYYPVVLR